jgi:putative membrane protein|tara:strand:- start:562 stop:1101 length:540 start_codon:yes stop_codon:yes gene_type:complete
MTYGIVKALHIIAFTCWFAGLFYVVRLFIYNTEARDRADNPELIEQLTVMQTRLWRGITNPAMVFTMIFGLWLASMYGGAYGGVPTWLLIKFGLLGLLLGYHHLLSHIHRRILDGTSTWTSKSLRMINEVATLFLVSIVFVAVLKNTLTLSLAATILAIFIVLLVGGFLLYQKVRKANE